MIELVLNDTWQNLRELASLSPSDNFTIFNKSSSILHIADTTLAPTDSRDGWVVVPFGHVDIQSNINPIWVKGDGPVAVVESGRVLGGGAFPYDSIVTGKHHPPISTICWG